MIWPTEDGLIACDGCVEWEKGYTALEKAWNTAVPILEFIARGPCDCDPDSGVTCCLTCSAKEALRLYNTTHVATEGSDT
jgi:hypothetical protein